MVRHIQQFITIALKQAFCLLILGLFGNISLLTPAPAIAQEEMRDSATVIMYHRFGEDRYPSTNIRLAQFEEHLALLTNGDYTILPLPEIVATLQAGGSLPDRTVAITIDDAYLSVYEEAWPRLQELGLPFTVFVATEPVEKNRRGYMSWEMLRELQSAGVTIGSQTHTHPHLYRESPEKVREEIQLSNDYFIKELGMRPELFAYPFGEYSSFVIEIVKEAGFVAAFGQNSGIMHSKDSFLSCHVLPLTKITAQQTGWSWP